MSEPENPTPAPTPAPPAAAPVTSPEPPRIERPSRRDRMPREGSRPPALKPLDDLTSRVPNLRELDASLEAEMEAALAGFDQQALVAADRSPIAQPGQGTSKTGRIIAIHGEDVFIDVPGGRSQGMMSRDQFEDAPPVIGNEVVFDIEGYDRANGLLILKKKGAVQNIDWSSVTEGMVVEARVVETNKGGLSVEVNGIRGFMPISQIDICLLYTSPSPRD